MPPQHKSIWSWPLVLNGYGGISLAGNRLDSDGDIDIVKT